MKYHKLVRDNIPDIIQSHGDQPIVHVAGEVEYWEKLKEKLHEEVEEFAKDENIEELADILEVLDAIAEYKQFSSEEIQRVKSKKAAKNGKFQKRVILDES